MKTFENAVDAIHAGARTLLTLGILLVVLGLLSLMAPWASGLAVQFMVGFLMIGAGVIWTVVSFHAHAWGSGLWEALVGVLTIISGMILVSHPIVGLTMLTLVLGCYFMASGVLKIVFAFRHKPINGWGWILLNGIVSIVLGGIITYQWPFSGSWVIGTLVGIDLLLGGFSLIRMGSEAKRVQ